MFYPVSEPERHFWNLYHLEEHKRQLRVAVRLPDGVDEALARVALERVISRHPRLRSRFPVVDGDVVRQELPTHAVSKASRAEVAGSRFAIRDAAPFRWWIRGGGSHRRLLCEVHHIAMDAAAASTLRQELSAELETAATPGDGGAPVGQVPHRPSTHAGSERATAYFADVLADVRPLVFATRRTGLWRKPRRAVHCEFLLDEVTVGSVLEAARAARTSLSMLLMAYYACLMQQCSLTDDVLLPYDFGNRTQEERHVVNNVALPLFVRVRMHHEDPLLADVVRQVRDLVLMGIGHREYSVDDLWDRVVHSCRSSAFPSPFQLVGHHGFNLYSEQEHRTTEHRPPFAHVSRGPRSATPMLLSMSHRGGVLHGTLRVNEDQLPYDVARVFLATFIALCRAGPAVLGLRLSEVASPLHACCEQACDGGPRVTVAGVSVSLSELEELGDMAIRSEPCARLTEVEVEVEVPEGVVFRVLAHEPDSELVVRVQRRLATHLLKFPHLALAGRVVVVDNRTGLDVSMLELSVATKGSRAPQSEAERLLCSLLSDVTGVPIGPEDDYVASGGSLADLPRVVAAMVARGLPVPPLFPLFAGAPVEVYASTLGRRMATGEPS